MKQYTDMLIHVQEQGRFKNDRTGVGCYSVFGYQTRFDLSQGFPLLTNKFTSFKAIAHELIWILSGQTNIEYLKENGVKIWDEWATPAGDLGPVYGHQWRNFGFQIDQLEDLMFNLRNRPFSRRHVISAWNPMDLSDESISAQDNVAAGKMALAPCHCLFQFHVEQLTQDEILTQAFKEIIYIDGESLQRLELASGENSFLMTDGTELEAAGIKRILVSTDISVTGERSHRLKVLRFGTADHRYQSIGEIKDYLIKMARHYRPDLCTTRLSCQLYQRSADIFLGVPFNIASYALLTHMIAHSLGMMPGEFIHTFGDLHLYCNHIAQARELLDQDEYVLPTLRFLRRRDNPWEYTFDDFVIEDYTHGGVIKAPVAI